MDDIRDLLLKSLSVTLVYIREFQDAIDDDTISGLDSMDIRRIKAKANRIQEVAVNIPFLPK